MCICIYIYIYIASDSRIYICKVICKCIAVKNYESVHKRTDVMRTV